MVQRQGGSPGASRGGRVRCALLLPPHRRRHAPTHRSKSSCGCASPAARSASQTVPRGRHRSL